MNSVNHIAIVGCGFSGTSAFHQLVHNFPVKEVTIFEATGRFGPGYPYALDEDASYLINNTTDTMCLAPDNRRAFLEWLEKQPDIDVSLSPKGHLPRNVYGIFLESAFTDACSLAERKGIRVRKLAGEVISLKETRDNGVLVAWCDGELRADAVIMTTGRCPDASVAPAPPATASAIYIDNHIGCDALEDISIDAEIHILGASLSAYDIVNRLFADKTGCRFVRKADGELVYEAGANQRSITLCSRSGRLKKMQSYAPQDIDRSEFTLKKLSAGCRGNELSLEAAADAIAKEADDHRAKIDTDLIKAPYKVCKSSSEVTARAGEVLAADIDAAKNGKGANFLVDLIDDAQIDLWDGFADQMLSPDAERQYREVIETAMLAYAAPCPIPTAERLLALLRAGRLKIVTGVCAPSLSEDETFFNLPHTHGEERASILINATGKVDRDINSPHQPQWVKNMVMNGELRGHHRNGFKMPGADIDMKSFRPRGSRYIYFANMLLWGPGIFTSSAFMMATIVSRILYHIYPKTYVSMKVSN